ncbi:MAG: terminase large subunit domain-containing protein [Agriterribacter sp.]
MVQQVRTIKPQPGFQEDFLSSEADIVIGGGAAGAGKTFAELLEALRHKEVPKFNAMFFRRTTVQIRTPGGLWDESSSLYPLFGGNSNSQHLTWYFKSGALVKFSHLEHEQDIYQHQGGQYCLIIFDELTHFTKKQFMYLLSRNRSVCGVKPYVRATCNPDAESFVAEMIEWYIDQEERLPNGEPNPHYGYPIEERVGKIRYFLVDKDEFVWGDSKQEVIDKCPHIFEDEKMAGLNPEHFIKSFTFIPGTIYGNKELMDKNPEYLANLKAQDESEQNRLLLGNWKIVNNPLCIFQFTSIENMFHNIYPSNTAERYITCDAARFGQDFTTIFVWYGWKVIKLIVITKSDAQEIVDAIEEERARYEIVLGKCIVDQDGVGGGVVKLGRYVGFSGGDPPLEERVTNEKKKKENYKTLKTQLYYRFAERVNNDEVAMPLSNDNVKVDGYFGVKVKFKGKLYDVRDLIKRQFRVIRKHDPDAEGKKQINPKEEQKNLLNGMSPDFADGAMLRSYFEFRSGELKTAPPSKSILDKI